MKLALHKALLPILFLIVLLVVNIYVFGDDALGGSCQFVLLIAAFFTMGIGFLEGVGFKTIITSVKTQIGNVSEALIVLLLVGALTSSWLSSGVIPTMVYYGLYTLHPSFFLTACVLISIIVSLLTGSSWTTSATVGVALIGIAKTLGINEAMTAGAILSGAYFGDKISPLSDTTNLAASIAGATLENHIKYMLLTTLPSIGLTLVIFSVIGWSISPETDVINSTIAQDIQASFHISPWLLLVPVTTILLIVKKVPSVLCLFIGALIGGFTTLLVQPDIITSSVSFSGSFLLKAYKAIISILTEGVTVDTNNPLLKDLFQASGMKGMLSTIWLIICAMVLGGTLEAIGALKTISEKIVEVTKNITGLMVSTTALAMFTNLTASDQYLSIVVPGKMLKKAYQDKGLAPENLSRTLEDSGTATSSLIPWSTCGAFQSQTLGVDVASYAFYAFFCWLSPLVSLTFIVLRIKLKKIVAA